MICSNLGDDRHSRRRHPAHEHDIVVHQILLHFLIACCVPQVDPSPGLSQSISDRREMHEAGHLSVQPPADAPYALLRILRSSSCPAALPDCVCPMQQFCVLRRLSESHKVFHPTTMRHAASIEPQGNDSPLYRTSIVLTYSPATLFNLRCSRTISGLSAFIAKEASGEQATSLTARCGDPVRPLNDGTGSAATPRGHEVAGRQVTRGVHESD